MKMRKYFNKWKKNIKDRNKTLGPAGLYIIKVMKMHNAKNFFDKLKNNNKEKILTNLFNKYAKLRPNNKDILDSYFTKWRYFTKKLTQINNANIIQKFCEIKLRKLAVIKKWKKLYSLLKDKVLKNNLKNDLNKLKKYIGVIRLLKKLKGNNRNNIYDKKHMAYFFNRLNDLLNDLNNQNYAYLFLKRVIKKQNDKKRKNNLKTYLNIWKNIVADYEITKLKGKLLLKLYDKYKNAKIREILKKVLSKWDKTLFLDKIKNKINKENIDKYTKINKMNKTTIITRSVLRNINRKNNDIILRKFINRWKKNIRDRNKNINEAGDQLLKIFRKNKIKDFIGNLKETKKYNILRKIIIMNERPNEDILDSYFSKWRYISKKMTQINYAKIIQKFCEIKLFYLRNIKRWKKLGEKLKNKDRNNDIKNIIDLLKYYKGLKKIVKTLKGINKKDVFDLLNRQKDSKKISYILIEIIEKYRVKDNENLLRRYLYKWRNNTRKKNNKEESLQKMMEVLEIKTIKNSVNYLTDVFQIYKLLNDINKARALYFLRKIKQLGKKNDLYNNLANDLVYTNEDLLKQKRYPLINKILKIYAYKVLSNLFDNLNKLQKDVVKTNMKDLLQRLYEISIKKKRKKYRKVTKLERKPLLRKGMKFHLNTKPKIKRDEKDNKTIVYRQLAPSLVKYLNKKFLNRKSDVFETIRYNNVGLGEKFCKLLKIFTKKTHIPDKEDLVDSLKYYVYMKLTKVTSSEKLYYLIRKAIIRKILNISKKTGNLTRILHLISITFTHKKISKDRWLLRLIKKWRFLTFVKKMAMKKMELMYNDLHVTYLEMADSVLKDGSPLGPNGTNFLHNFNKDKYFYEFYDPYLVKGAKPYKTIKKQYVFEPLDAEVEKTIKTIEEIKTIDKTKKINREYFEKDDDNIGKYTKKYNVMTTKKIDIKPKKMGKVKLKKSGKGEGSSSYKEFPSSYIKGGIKGSFKDKGFKFEEGDLRESTHSEMKGVKGYGKADSSNFASNEIRESNKSEIKKVGNNFGIEQKNLGKDSSTFKIDDMRRDDKTYNNVQIFTSSYVRGSDVKNIKK